MSFLNVFGRAPPPPPAVPAAAAEDASAMLNRRISELEKTIKQCDAKIETYKRSAVERARKGDRAGAGRDVQLYKMEESKKMRAYTWLQNIEVVSGRITDMAQMKLQAEAMQAAASTLKQQAKILEPSKLEDMMEDLNTAMEDIGEASEVLSQQLEFPGAISSSEVDAELAKLMEGEAAPVMPMGLPAASAASMPIGLPQVPVGLPTNLPSVPTGAPVVQRPAAAAAAGGAGGGMMDELAALEGM